MKRRRLLAAALPLHPGCTCNFVVPACTEVPQQKQSVGTSVHAHDGHPGTPDNLCCIKWSTEAKNLHQGFFCIRVIQVTQIVASVIWYPSVDAVPTSS